MTALQFYLAIVTLLFSFLGLIWTRTGAANTLLKFVFFWAAVAGGVLLAQSCGYILKV